MDFLKSGPSTEALRIESEPPGAEAKVASGQSCRTPCELKVQPGSDASVTFALAGYQPHTVSLRSEEGESGKIGPNPVYVELKKEPAGRQQEEEGRGPETQACDHHDGRGGDAAGNDHRLRADAAASRTCGGTGAGAGGAQLSVVDRQIRRCCAFPALPSSASRSHLAALDALVDIGQSCHI